VSVTPRSYAKKSGQSALPQMFNGTDSLDFPRQRISGSAARVGYRGFLPPRGDRRF
jgi:hypothetical protein